MQALLPALFGAAGDVHHADFVSDFDGAKRPAPAGEGGAGAWSCIGAGAGLQSRQFDLLWTGVIGGTLAYGLHRVQRARSAESMSAEMQSYLILVLIGFLPSEIWRWLGIVLGRGLDEQSEIILWVRGGGDRADRGRRRAYRVHSARARLPSVPLSVRLAALAAGFLAFLFIRRSAFAGVVAGEAVLVAGALAFGP